MEEWAVIHEFPTYEVSNYGQVRNRSTGRILKQTKSPTTGLWWVGLRKNLEQHTRSIHRLVATYFIHPAPDEAVPIHLDGDVDNNHVDNLEWKSRSFARDYNEQLQRDYPLDPRPVIMVSTGEEFRNTREAAEAVGGLEKYIRMAAGSSGTMSYAGSRWIWAMGYFQ